MKTWSLDEIEMVRWTINERLAELGEKERKIKQERIELIQVFEKTEFQFLHQIDLEEEKTREVDV